MMCGVDWVLTNAHLRVVALERDLAASRKEAADSM
jgi:hypothetical protein